MNTFTKLEKSKDDIIPFTRGVYEQKSFINLFSEYLQRTLLSVENYCFYLRPFDSLWSRF